MNFTLIERLLILSVFLLGSHCQGQHQEKSYASQKEFYEKRVQQYLLKDESIRGMFAISDSGITLYREVPIVKEKDTKATKSTDAAKKNKATKTKKEVEYHLPWQKLDIFKRLVIANPIETYEMYQRQKLPTGAMDVRRPRRFRVQTNSAQPLKGLRVALDPGHMAGSLEMAKKERKFVDITLKSGKRLSFYESKLAWYTCAVLADMLKEKGAEVRLTRNRFDLMALDSTYQQVFANYQKQQKKEGKTIKSWQKWPTFFKKFRKADFIARADKINQFQPHLTMIVHYNVDGSNAPWNKTTKQNHSMAFVSGSFMKNELSKTEHRFNFLRLLLTQDIEQSIDFSAEVLKAINKKLRIPTLPTQNNQPFIDRACMTTQQTGVYARNLSMARKVYGTLCFIEPLYQENEKEILKLAKNDYDYQGKKIPKRVVEVAEAYFDGIMAYLKK
ncbi:hypothetical protein BKI52_10595 [marine bacterium AO1-C]|nr:hypothetical protein BKI52_10595 [marine bacterium AO1-C]